MLRFLLVATITSAHRHPYGFIENAAITRRNVHSNLKYLDTVMTGRYPLLQMKRDNDRYYDDDEDDDDEYWEKVPVPRRGSSRRNRFDGDREEELQGSSYYEQSSYYDVEDELDDRDFHDDDDEDDEEYDMFSDVVIPNPLLDSIDPDGAADRFPELAPDTRFWIDLVLFVAALNFLSELGPRNPSFFPWNDIPWQSM